MLFNSFVFLLGFLPLALAVHAAAARYAPQARLPALLALSVVFYGYWDWRFIPLLVLSVLINWLVAQVFVRKREAGAGNENALIGLAIALNLAVLGVFMYAITAYVEQSMTGWAQRSQMAA